MPPFSQTPVALAINTPRWAKPLFQPKRYKGIRGGRGGGKSHEVAEEIIELMYCFPDFKVVCIREYQKSLKFSAKALLESKIKKFGLSRFFKITNTEIRRIGGDGVIIFQGMQDHTADSIKGLENFDLAWCEEAQKLSDRSMRLLRPTLRKENSEIWFTWNPENETDPVERLFNCAVNFPDDHNIEVYDNGLEGEEGMVCIHVNSDKNPFISKTLVAERERDREADDPETFAHIWLGKYNKISKAQVFTISIRDFEPNEKMEGPYYGLDFGFSSDPTAGVRLFIEEDKDGKRRLYVRNEAVKVGLELDETTTFLKRNLPGIASHTIRADNARPESISFLKRNGLSRMKACEKGKGSVEDGVAFIKSFDEIIVHPDCEQFQEEARLYRYKIDKLSGDVLPVIIDNHNHLWDATRYALEPIMKSHGTATEKDFESLGELTTPDY